MRGVPEATATAEQVPVGDLKQHPDNPRQGDIGAIVESIRTNGWYGTVIAQKSTGHVLAGNHRLEAARQLGIETVPVVWLDVDDDRARRILLVDNRTNDLAAYDDRALAELLTEMAGDPEQLLGTGYDGDALDQLLADLDSTHRPIRDYEGPPSVKKAIFDGTDLRQIILTVRMGEFGWAMRVLREIMQRENFDSNAAAVLNLLRKWCDENGYEATEDEHADSPVSG